MKRIAEFEALRGFLALWVVIGHVLKWSGYMPENFGHLSSVADPGLAVDVFIILSGFVIFNLLDQQQQTYTAFVVQRFFRLYPLYLAVLIASVATASFKQDWIQHLPWHSEFLVGARAIDASSTQYLLAHILVHLTMLHGLISDSILPFSQYAIIGQAWSISVEWQFYLVAPLLLLCVRKSPLALAMIVAVVVFVHSLYWLGDGFAINQGGYFLIGILSYFLFKRLKDRIVDATNVWLGVFMATALAAYFSYRPISMMIWFIFLGAAISTSTKQKIQNPISAICHLPAPLWLGRISYSIYLTHFLVLFGASALLLDWMPMIGQLQQTELLMPITIAGTLTLSLLTFRLIEKPGIDLGRRLAARASVRKVQLASPSE